MTLHLGDKIPEFSATDANGNHFSSAAVIGKQKVVIYFYLKDFTPGCTKQACLFKDNHKVFEEYNTKVIGVSPDAVEQHQKFKEKNNLPFTLLADPTGKLAEQFHIKKSFLGLFPGRETLIINEEGELVERIRSYKSTAHVERALQTLKKIHNEN